MTAPFLGRTRELQELAALHGESLVTLWGPGGVGKTRLAREHTERMRAQGRAVAWTDLASARTRRETITALAAALGVALLGYADDDDVLAALARAASAQRVLLVADNLEQLDGDARATVSALAARCTGASVLATSRGPLGGAGEVAIALAPLAEDDGVALFEALVRTGLASGAGDESVRAIVRRLDALPLAIELAAARVPLLGTTELLSRLDRKLDVLRAPPGKRPERHATLRAAIAWSWEMLDEVDRAALMACATFESPFDAALAEAVIEGDEADALDALERLRGRALVQAATDARGVTTLRLLESVRDFAREASGEHAGPWIARHAMAIVARAEPLAEAARAGRDTLAELDALRADLVVAARADATLGSQTVAPAGDGTLVARAVLALAALLAISGPAAAVATHVDGALATLTTSPSDALLRTRLLVAKGAALRALGSLPDAQRVLASARESAERMPSDRHSELARAEVARGLGAVLRSLGHTEPALAEHERALATYRAVGERAQEGICLGEIGAVHQSAGRLELARRHHAEAIAIHVATGSRRAEGVERSYLAVATHRAGDPAASLPLHEAALAIHREAGHRRLEGAELLHLGFVHHELGSIDAARSAFAAARAVLTACGASGLLGLALVFASRLEADVGEPTTALLLLAEAAQSAPTSWPRARATHHLVSGHLALATGATARAAQSYEAALSVSTDLEVGFEALTPAYLLLATSRLGASSAADALADARARVRTLENPHLRVAFAVLEACALGAPVPEVPASAVRASSEVRRALAFAGARRALTIENEGRRVVLPDGRAIDLSRRKNVRLVMLALARARRDAKGTTVALATLLEAGWPGERMRADAATKRLHTAIWTLRSVGLEGFLLTEGEGYLLDPEVDLVL